MHNTNEYIELQSKKVKRTVQVDFVKMMLNRLLHYGFRDDQLRHMYDIWVADVSIGHFALLTDDINGTLTFTVKHGKMRYTYIYPGEFYWIMENQGL